MTFPSATAAPSVVTEFVNGIKFDICEVVPGAYDMLNSSKARFFLCVEDSTIVNYSAAEGYFAATGESRWDLFCCTKGDCLARIKAFSDACDKIESLLAEAAKRPGLAKFYTDKANALRVQYKNIYGKTPA